MLERPAWVAGLDPEAGLGGAPSRGRWRSSSSLWRSFTKGAVVNN